MAVNKPNSSKKSGTKPGSFRSRQIANSQQEADAAKRGWTSKNYVSKPKPASTAVSSKSEKPTISKAKSSTSSNATKIKSGKVADVYKDGDKFSGVSHKTGQIRTANSQKAAARQAVNSGKGYYNTGASKKGK
jgi:hypothetical protein